jgi:hypothetical protein
MSDQNLPLLIFVGGFLGAGKTTLILKAAARLTQQGKRVAVITNDQDVGLVDTAQAKADEVLTQEVAGGCFCCRFSELIEAAEALANYRPEVIFAEPVGSCIDLSATILQPLKAFYQDRFRLAPLTVLLDPVIVGRANKGQLDEDIHYLFRQQIGEADLVCLTKQDLGDGLPGTPFPIDFRLSTVSGEGIQDWLAEVQDSKRVVGAKLLDVDYQRYAEAEAALGWLNLHAEIQTTRSLSPAALCGPLFETISDRLKTAGLTVAHFKLFDRCTTGWLKISLSANDREPVPEGDLLASPAFNHQLALNLRAVGEPAVLRQIVEAAMTEVPGTCSISHLGAFRPAAPKPEHRFSDVVG